MAIGISLNRVRPEAFRCACRTAPVLSPTSTRSQGTMLQISLLPQEANSPRFILPGSGGSAVHPEVVGWGVVRRWLLPRPARCASALSRRGAPCRDDARARRGARRGARRVGRGEGWGEGKPCRVDGPPLPVPLLPPREEREKPLTTSGCTSDRARRVIRACQHEGRAAIV